MNASKNIFWVSLLFLCCCSIQGQDLEQLGGPAIKVSGSISTGASFYDTRGQENRKSPYSYFVSANPVFSLYGIDIPLSFIYRDQESSLSNPFQRFRISPKYKWVSLHAGDVNMTFSPYTLNGQVVRGGGLELTPGKFKFAAIYGKMLNQQTQLDSLVAGAELLETFEREAMGLQMGLNANKYKAIVSVFRAKDDAEDSNVLINTDLVKPEENVVIGLDLNMAPFKWLKVYAHAAGSALTSNQNSIGFDTDAQDRLEQVGEIYTLNFSSKIQFAGDAGIDFKFKPVGFGFEYKRVDPLYRSLGTFYFQEDYENYTGKINFALLQGKIRFNGRGGLQRNNLSKLRTFTNSKTIANVSATYTPSRKYFINARFSNFQSDREPELQNINDSLRITNTTAVYGLTNRVTFGKDLASTITLVANYQNLVDLLGSEDTGRSIDNYIASLGYGHRWKEKGMQFNSTLNYNQNLILDRETQRFGGNLRFSFRVLQKTLTISSSAGYFKNLLNGAENGDSYSGRLGFNYKVNKKFRASIHTNYLYRTRETGDVQEFRGNVKVTYIFPSLQTKSKLDNPEPKAAKVKESKLPKKKEPKVKKVKEPKVQKIKEAEAEKVKEPKAEKVKEPKVQKIKESKAKKEKQVENPKSKNPKNQKTKELKPAVDKQEEKAKLKAFKEEQKRKKKLAKELEKNKKQYEKRIKKAKANKSEF